MSSFITISLDCGSHSSVLQDVVDWTLKRGVEQQVSSLLHGFNSVVSTDELSVFTESELDALICGEQNAPWKESGTFDACMQRSSAHSRFPILLF